jgi:hypothetical protein
MEGSAHQVELRIDKDRVASQHAAIEAAFTLAGTVASHMSATGATYEDLRYTPFGPGSHRITASRDFVLALDVS